MYSIVFFITTLFALSSASAARLPGEWPTQNQVPTMQPQWASLVDFSDVSNAPIQQKLAGDCNQTSIYCNWSCDLCLRPGDVKICPAQNDWALTYDDGPTLYTPGVLDYLKEKNVTATFFVIGSRVIDYPDMIKRAVDEGHQIGVHTWSHPALTTLTNEQIVAEIKWTEAAIKAAAGVTPKFLRPPYGDFDDRVRSIATRLGYKIAIWDIDTSDWQTNSNPFYDPNLIINVVKSFTNQTLPTGHVSLEHDAFLVAAATAPKVLDVILQAGFSVKPVGACIGEKFYVEDGGGSITTTSLTSTSTNAAASTSSIAITSTSSSTSVSATPTSVTPNDVTNSNANATVTSVDVPSATDSSQTSNASLSAHHLSSFALFVVSTFCVMVFGSII